MTPGREFVPRTAWEHITGELVEPRQVRWHINVPPAALDVRVNLREEIGRVRKDPNVIGFSFTNTKGIRSQETLLFDVLFAVGTDGPADATLQDLPERIAAFVPDDPGAFQRRESDQALGYAAPFIDVSWVQNPVDPSTALRSAALPRGEVLARLREGLNTPEGRARLGAAMAAPIRHHLGLTRVARQTMIVSGLPDGETPIAFDDQVDALAAAFRHGGVNPDGEQNLPEPSGFTRVPLTGFTRLDPYATPRVEDVANADGGVTMGEVFGLPYWCVPGTWVRSKLPDGGVLQIGSVEDRTIVLWPWRSPTSRTWHRPGQIFTDDYELAESPEKPRTAFERLDDDWCW
jgi:hypothetical protein